MNIRSNSFLLQWVILLLLGYGCTIPDNEDQLSLMNGIAFAKAEKEIALPTTDTAITKPYERYFNQRADLQIPLFKYLKHPDYQIYIGLPYGLDLRRLSAKIKAENALENNNGVDYYHQIRQLEGVYLIEYAQQFEQGRALIYLAAETRDSSRLAYFSAPALRQRLILEK